jgi:catechol 2,3-dioxygenase-like lactoylglutathione lyase family enzyme
MISHVTVGVGDFARALQFYRAVMGKLDVEARFCDDAGGWAGWQPIGGGRPLFVICKPYDGAPYSAGNGQMVALLASSRAQVDAAHAAALASGGYCEGAPGLRPHYHPNYYGAYFRDTEGNKLCVVCHQPE